MSPLAIVPKWDPGEFRLLHDLSFPKHNSVNSHVPQDFTTVQSELLDTCIEHILEIWVGCQVAKADLKDAFRIIPVCPLGYHLLGFTFQNKFYFDMCLPMGCSVSCQIFEALSCALQWICINKFRVSSMRHILDDFIFFGPPHSTVPGGGSTVPVEGAPLYQWRVGFLSPPLYVLISVVIII